MGGEKDGVKKGEGNDGRGGAVDQKKEGRRGSGGEVLRRGCRERGEGSAKEGVGRVCEGRGRRVCVNPRCGDDGISPCGPFRTPQASAERRGPETPALYPPPPVFQNNKKKRLADTIKRASERTRTGRQSGSTRKGDKREDTKKHDQDQDHKARQSKARHGKKARTKHHPSTCQHGKEPIYGFHTFLTAVMWVS